MRYLLSFGVAALCFSTASVATAQNVPPVELIKQAIAAEGGVEALRAVKGVILKGDARHWEPQQSFTPDVEPRFIGDSKLTISWDSEKNLMRSDWDRDLKYPFVERDIARS
jgi:hypothetical protein